MTNANSISTISNNQTMSSLEIAKITNKRHPDVIRDIRSMIDSIKDDAEMLHELNQGVVDIKDNSTQQSTAIQAITFANAENPKMSSLDIAKFTGKRHDHVMRDIEKMFAELNIHAPHFWGTYKTKQGNEYGCFNLPKRETLILISGYSAKVRALIIDRWIELEKQVAQVKASRLDGKEARKLETGAIKDLVEYAEASGSKSANMYYANITRMTNSILGIESGQRDNLTVKQLDQVRIAETMVKMAISDGLEQSLPYKEIYKLCKDRVSNIAKVLLN